MCHIWRAKSHVFLIALEVESFNIKGVVLTRTLYFLMYSHGRKREEMN